MSGEEHKLRLAAIFAADVAGYSRLMSVDERATVAALDAARAVFRTQIESNQGRVIDMAGDSVLALFETAKGAVGAAIAVQKSLNETSGAVPEDRRMHFRIGVHLGDVIEKGDGTAYGDGVNIAARLEGLAAPGGITVSDSVRNAVHGKVIAAFEDQGEQTVKNIAEPVRAFRVIVTSGSSSKLSATAGAIDLSLPDKPSIAVLPFSNMSGDPEQEYFTDGVTEDIITELSRFRSLFVIARNSSFTYKHKSVDVRTVAKELGVRYVLEGSIRRAGNRVRVTGQLIDALIGSHIWAERYDRLLEDIFAVQEEITRTIVVAIAPQIEASEAAKHRPMRPGNMSAYETAVRAWADARTANAEADLVARDRAIRLAKDALATDPGCSLALAALAYAHWQHLLFRTASNPDECKEEGITAANRAIALDKSEYRAYRCRGLLLIVSGQHAAGLADLRRAYALNSNDTSVLFTLAFYEAVAGNPKAGIEHASNALRLSPRDPWRYQALNALAWSHFFVEDYAASIQSALQAIADAPHYPSAHVSLAVSYAALGELEKSRAEVEILRRLAPELLEERLAGRGVITKSEYRARVTTLLRVAAGLEDPNAAEAPR